MSDDRRCLRCENGDHWSCHGCPCTEPGQHGHPADSRPAGSPVPEEGRRWRYDATGADPRLLHPDGSALYRKANTKVTDTAWRALVAALSGESEAPSDRPGAVAWLHQDGDRCNHVETQRDCTNAGGTWIALVPDAPGKWCPRCSGSPQPGWVPDDPDWRRDGWVDDFDCSYTSCPSCLLRPAPPVASELDEGERPPTPEEKLAADLAAVDEAERRAWQVVAQGHRIGGLAADEPSRVVAGRIRTLRERAQVTQEALAERIGVTATCVSYWETHRRMVKVDDLPTIAAALDVAVGDLLPSAFLAAPAAPGEREADRLRGTGGEGS